MSTLIGPPRAEMEEVNEADQARGDEGDGVVVVTDLFGGSPSNLSLPACSARNRVILFGANLPMLVKLAKLRNLAPEQAAAMAAEAGRKYIDSYNVFEDVAPRKVAQ